MFVREDVGALLAVIFVVSGLVAGQGDPDLEVLPSGDMHTKPVHGAIVFTCTAVNVPIDTTANLKWRNKENLEITDTTGRSRMYVELVQNTVLKLYITSIQNQDAGTYTCEGDLGGLIEKRVTLEIFKDITFDHAPSPQHPATGTNALIECEVSGQPTPEVSWRFRGQTLITGGRYIVGDNGLQILNTSKEVDDGLYRCRGEVPSDGRMKEKHITVAVHTPPTITDPLGDHQQGIEGQEVALQCGATGDPMPKYEFYRMNNGAEVPVQPGGGEDGNRVEVDRDSGQVLYRPIIKGDEGEYKCKAHNDVGEAESIGTLTVLVPPKIHTLINQTAEEGQSQTLSCLTTGDPAPTMTFRKMGNDYEYENGDNEGGKIVIVNPEAGHLDMTIKNLVPEDTDNYTCKAMNEAGEDKLNGTLIVHYTPRFPEDHKVEYFLWVGKTRNITCNIHSEPEPLIRWYKDGRELVNNETYRIYTMKKNSNLQITCREEDESWIYAEYTCEASNHVGMGDIDIQVLRANNTGMIAFSVGLSDEVNNAPGTHLTVPYDVVNLNVGGGFDPASYQFVAPVAGIYQFSFCMLSQTGGGRMVVSLTLNGDRLSSTHGYYNGFDPGCQIQLVQLVPTDAISVVIRDDSEKGMYESSNKYSTFSGYLIHETI